MSDEQIAIEVAKLDGWFIAPKDWKHNGELYPEIDTWIPPRFKDSKSMPIGTPLGCRPMSYLTSRDAIIPVIEKAHPATVDRCGSIILEEVGKYWESQGRRIDWNRQANTIMAVLQASPRQLCIALLKATGDWKE